jgi:HPt (histidine-containing phosphotransfer) domain-containing protein
MAQQQARNGALDLEILTRQTLGDRELESDLFALFEIQAERLWPILAGRGDRGARSEAAHTMKGAAAAIGATEVRSLAGELEVAFDRPGPEPVALLKSLDRALDEARSAIAAWRSAA